VGSGGVIGLGGQTGTGGAAGQSGHGGAAGSGAQTGAGGSGTCQSTTLAFTSPPSSVLILTDRGGSSFDTPAAVGALPTTGSFFNVRAAVEDTIAGVQGQYRFGLGVFVGDHTSGACQLNYATAPIALNNAAAIAAAYDALGPLSGKADTPASAAITMAQTALLADGVGSKFLLFITSGATDFCDDGAAACPNDVVVSQLQTMYAASPSIETLVVGLSTASTSLVPGTAATFANAGAGQPTAVAALAPENTPSGVYYQCMGVSPWAALFAASKKTAPTALGTYAAANGTAPLYMAATNGTGDVETQVKAALAAMKSCSFQLTAHSINPAKVTEGTVTVGGTNYAEDAANGWSMPSSTVVTLNGAACSSYRQTGAAVAINFPCDAIVP